MVATHELSLTDQIRLAIHERRPDRYTPGDDDSAGWLDAIAEEFAPQIEAADAQKRAARAMVGSIEAAATRSTNKILRESLVQPPLDWDFFRNLPLAVGGERVAIRACTPEDFRQFAREERERADADYAAREATIRAATRIADMMEELSIRIGADLRWE